MIIMGKNTILHGYSTSTPVSSSLSLSQAPPTPCSTLLRPSHLRSSLRTHKANNHSCSSCDSDLSGTPGRHIRKPRFSKLSQKFKEKSEPITKRVSAVKLTKLDVKPPINRKSKNDSSESKSESESTKNAVQKNSKSPKINDKKSNEDKSKQKENNPPTEVLTDIAEKDANKKRKTLNKSKADKPPAASKHNMSTRSNLSKSENVSKDTFDSLDDSKILMEPPKDVKHIKRVTEKHLNPKQVDNKTSKTASNFLNSSKASFIRRKLYSLNLDVGGGDDKKLDSSFLDSVSVKNIYEPKKKARQSSDQNNLNFNPIKNGGTSVDTTVKYSLRKNDTMNNAKNTTTFSKLVSGILSGISNRTSTTSEKSNTNSDQTTKEPVKSPVKETKQTKPSEIEDLDDSALSIFSRKCEVPKDTETKRSRNVKKPSPKEKKKAVPVKKESKGNARKNRSADKIKDVSPKIKNKVVKEPKQKKSEKNEKHTTIEKETKQKRVEKEMKQKAIEKRSKQIIENDESLSDNESMRTRSRNRVNYLEDSAEDYSMVPNNKVNKLNHHKFEEPQSYFSYKSGKSKGLFTSGKFPDIAYDSIIQKPNHPRRLPQQQQSSKICVMTRNDTIISNRIQMPQNAISFCNKNTTFNRHRPDLKQIQETRQLVDPYSLVEQVPETFSWREMRDPSRKRKFDSTLKFSNEMSSMFRNQERSMMTNITCDRSFFPGERTISKLPSKYHPPAVSNTLVPVTYNQSIRPWNDTVNGSYYKRCLKINREIFNDDKEDDDGFRIPKSFPKRRKIVTSDELITFKGTFNEFNPKSQITMTESYSNHSRTNGNFTRNIDSTFKVPTSNVPFIYKGGVNCINQESTRIENVTVQKTSTAINPPPVWNVSKPSNVMKKLFEKHNLNLPSMKENSLPSASVRKFNEQSYSVKKYDSIAPPLPAPKVVENVEVPDLDADDDSSDFDVSIAECNQTVKVNHQAAMMRCSPWRFRK